MATAIIPTPHDQGDTLSLEAFKAWLQARRSAASAGMQTTTLEEFGKHLAVTIEVDDAWRTVWQFEREARA